MNGIWKYDHLLPSVQMNSRISLGEGNTPLIRSRQIGRSLGLENLFFKLEMVNPSGSYKDRFACLAISKMIESNHKNWDVVLPYALWAYRTAVHAITKKPLISLSMAENLSILLT